MSEEDVDVDILDLKEVAGERGPQVGRIPSQETVNTRGSPEKLTIYQVRD